MKKRFPQFDFKFLVLAVPMLFCASSTLAGQKERGSVTWVYEEKVQDQALNPLTGVVTEEKRENIAHEIDPKSPKLCEDFGIGVCFEVKTEVARGNDSEKYTAVKVRFEYGLLPFSSPDLKLSRTRALAFKSILRNPRGHRLEIWFDSTMQFYGANKDSTTDRYADQVHITDQTTGKKYNLDQVEELLDLLILGTKEY